MLQKAHYIYNEEDRDIYLTLKREVNEYLESIDSDKFANRFLILKTVLFTSIAILSYVVLLSTTYFPLFILSMFSFSFICLVIGMTLGHDAAHSSITSNSKIDNIIFELSFIINGINPSPWKIKHNKSHHSFPNVHEYDSDLEMSELIFLSDTQHKKWIHKFQHIYAPILYSFLTLSWIYFHDFVFTFSRNQGNLTMPKYRFQFFKILLVKIYIIGVAIAIPAMYSNFSLGVVLGTYLIVNMLVGLFLSFTFFISHHVTEVDHIHVSEPNKINNSWLRHQINSTVDFHGDSRVANLIFGGFHAHIAHHLFPNVCHVHYPAITSIIKKHSHHNDLNYRSISFHQGVLSHLEHLKITGA